MTPDSSFNIKETKQITGSNGAEDRERVKTIAVSMMLRAFKELEAIERLENLEVLLSRESMERATDGLAAARHIQAGLSELCEHFKETTIIEFFSKPLASVTNNLKEAEVAYGKLRALYGG